MLILKSYSPRDQKALGRKVHNFDEEVWTANCKEIVKTGNMAKVSTFSISLLFYYNSMVSQWNLVYQYPTPVI